MPDFFAFWLLFEALPKLAGRHFEVNPRRRAPAHDFESGLRSTVAWYVENRDWCRAVQAGRYDREPLGTK